MYGWMDGWIYICVCVCSDDEDDDELDFLLSPRNNHTNSSAISILG